MKNKKILYFQIFSIIFTSILGTILHFTYNWSNKNLFIASFSAINESVWEHLKLIFFPMLITTIIGYFYIGKSTLNFICAKTLGIIISLLFVVSFFYTYTGIIGTHLPIIDISSFFITIILGDFIAYKIIISNIYCNKNSSIIILCILLLCFIFFTYFQPNLKIFEEHISNTKRNTSFSSISFIFIYIHNHLYMVSYHSYKISFVLIFLALLLMLLQIFGNELLLFVLRNVMVLLLHDCLYINLLIFHKLLLLFVLLLNLLVSLLLGLLLQQYMVQ